MAADRMPWFKWWDGTAADMKFRMVAEDVKLPVACIVGAWAYLLEHASRSVDRGSIADVDYELMAYTLQIPDCETVCNAMKRRKLLHETGSITKWEDRQGKRERSEAPGASTERVRKMRERKKQSENNGLDDPAGFDGDATDETHVTPGNATKRPKKKNREEEEKNSKPKPSSSAGADGDGEKLKPFDRFWEAYPRKVAKLEAQKAWTSLKLNDKADEIVAAVLAQIDGYQFRRDGGQFIPHPATWLRGGRWLDVVQPWVEPPPKLPAGWWETHESLKAAGAMLSPPLVPRTGELKDDFRRRINQALGNDDRPPQQYQVVEPPRKLERPYVPPAPPPSVQLTPEQQEARKEEFREAMKKLKQSAGEATAGIQTAAADNPVTV